LSSFRRFTFNSGRGTTGFHELYFLDSEFNSADLQNVTLLDLVVLFIELMSSLFIRRKYLGLIERQFKAETYNFLVIVFEAADN